MIVAPNHLIIVAISLLVIASAAALDVSYVGSEVTGKADVTTGKIDFQEHHQLLSSTVLTSRHFSDSINQVNWIFSSRNLKSRRWNSTNHSHQG